VVAGTAITGRMAVCTGIVEENGLAGGNWGNCGAGFNEEAEGNVVPCICSILVSKQACVALCVYARLRTACALRAKITAPLAK
jgi:hypothetical protein